LRNGQLDDGGGATGKSNNDSTWFVGARAGWLMTPSDRAAGYLKRSAERLAKDVYPIIGDAKACDVSKRDVAAIVERAGHRGALTEANRLRALLHAIFGWACGTGRIETNPAGGIPRPCEEKARERLER
jgi:hypothetical protein